MRTFLAVSFCILTCVSQQSAQVSGPRIPRFEDYKVTTRFTGVPAKPRFTNPKELRANHKYFPSDEWLDSDERYRESVALDAEKGPNFAGHYTIAQWSCGSGCSASVVVDARTGQLYRKTPYDTLDVISGSRDYQGLSFRLDSSLLIVEGCVDVDFRPSGCSRSYYDWIPPRFKLIRKIKVEK